MKIKSNKKPHNDGTSWQADSSLQGSQITMDSNANHRARITRFSELRQHSRDMSSWLYHQQEKVRGIDDPNAKLLFQRLGHFANDLRGCGSQLLFKHYYTQDSYRLAHMRSCRRHMLCRFCSSIRATKQAMSYHAKMLQVLKDNPKLKPVFITLTVKNGDDLGERFNHLMSNFKTMQKARRDWLNRGTGHNELCKAHGIVYAVEITNRGRGWHPHIHMVALVDDWIDRKKLSQQWEAITGDSKIVDVRRLKPSKGTKNDYMEAFIEVFKYALKFSEMSHFDIWLAHETLSPDGRLKRLQGSIGLFRGVKVPEKMTDEQLSDDLPFMLVLYRFIRGAGYSVVSTQDFPFGEVTKGNLLEALKDLEASGEVLADLPKLPKPFSIYDEVKPPEVLPDWLLPFANDGGRRSLTTTDGLSNQVTHKIT